MKYALENKNRILIIWTFLENPKALYPEKSRVSANLYWAGWQLKKTLIVKG